MSKERVLQVRDRLAAHWHVFGTVSDAQGKRRLILTEVDCEFLAKRLTDAGVPEGPALDSYK